MAEDQQTTTTTTTTTTLQHLLVCVDLHDDSGRALADGLLERARVLAGAWGARVTVLSVVPPVSTPAIPRLGTESTAYKVLLEAAVVQRDGVRAALAAHTDRLQQTGVSADGRLLEADGNAADLIVSTAVEVGADVVVLASHSRKGIARALLGSVAERTAARSTVPVLIVPQAAL